MTKNKILVTGAAGYIGGTFTYEVLKKGFEVLELRALFTEKNDYANSIEPSHQGGEKIAKFITNWLS